MRYTKILVASLMSVLFLTLFGQLMSTELQNYIGKSQYELSGFGTGHRDIKQTSYWYDQVYTPIQSIVQRLNRNRYAHDYASNFQAALDSGGMVTFMAQDTVTLYGNTQLKVHGDTYIKGSGITSVLATKKTSVSTGVSCLFIDGDNVIVENMTFLPDPNMEFAMEHDHCIVIAPGCHNVVIRNCFFPYCIGDAIEIGGGVFDVNVKSKIVIDGNHMYGAILEPLHWPYSMSRNGISIVNGRDVIITNNVIVGFKGPGGIDIEPNPGVSQGAFSIIIANNIFRTHTNGIIVNALDETFGKIIITNNVITTIKPYSTVNAGYGIYYVGYGVNADSGSIITGNIVSNTHSTGIFVRNMRSPMTVSNNNVMGANGHGIQISGMADNVKVINNKVSGSNGVGINVYGYTVETSTTIIHNGTFDGISEWHDMGTPLLKVLDYSFGHPTSPAMRVRTDAANEGIKQVMNTEADTNFTVMITAQVLLIDDSTYSRVKMSVAGAKWCYEGMQASESNLDSTWHNMYVVFKPSGLDTLKFYSTVGGCAFLVDNVVVKKNYSSNWVDIVGNELIKNINGIKIEGWLVDGRITDNTIIDYKRFKTDVIVQDMGIYILDGILFSDLLDNKVYGSITRDLYLMYAWGSRISFSQIEKPYWNANAFDFSTNTFPYAHEISYYGLMPNAATVSPFGGWFNLQQPVRIIGMSSYADESFTDGIIYILPKVTSTIKDLGWNVSASIGFKPSGSVRGKRKLFEFDNDLLRSRAGDKIGFHVYSDMDIADTTGLRVNMLLEGTR
jgi:hypothetical protein